VKRAVIAANFWALDPFPLPVTLDGDDWTITDRQGDAHHVGHR